MTTKNKTAKANPAATKTRSAKKQKTQRRRTGGNVAAKKAPRQEQAKTSASLRENTKLATVIAMLRRKEGATIEQLVKATGWQAHSVRGALSGALKKNLGLAISSTKTDGVRTYLVTA
jgi:hypothetical protein